MCGIYGFMRFHAQRRPLGGSGGPLHGCRRSRGPLYGFKPRGQPAAAPCEACVVVWPVPLRAGAFKSVRLLRLASSCRCSSVWYYSCWLRLRPPALSLRSTTSYLASHEKRLTPSSRSATLHFVLVGLNSSRNRMKIPRRTRHCHRGGTRRSLHKRQRKASCLLGRLRRCLIPSLIQ